ncbi:MAG: hypothetical protein FWC85_02415, partial [Elusimicrobia bacterium]|nr:hypothetical protein [Elusimicrobiota bacterium]
MKKISIGEIIVAVIIIVLVVFVAVPRGRVLVLKAQEGVTKGNLGALRNAISLYYATNEGRFPGANIAEALVAGGFIEQIPYVYTPPHHPRNNIIITGLSDTDESLG